MAKTAAALDHLHRKRPPALRQREPVHHTSNPRNRTRWNRAASGDFERSDAQRGLPSSLHEAAAGASAPAAQKESASL